MTVQVEAFDIGNSFQQSVDSIFTYLPKVLAFLIIVIIGYIIAKVVVDFRTLERPARTGLRGGEGVEQIVQGFA